MGALQLATKGRCRGAWAQHKAEYSTLEEDGRHETVDANSRAQGPAQGGSFETTTCFTIRVPAGGEARGGMGRQYRTCCRLMNPTGRRQVGGRLL